MSKHTPGPWTVRNDFKLPKTYVCSTDGLKVARMMWDTKDGESNARLIAAAPDLLWALRYAAMFISYSEALSESKGAKDVLRVLDSAIAKAEGRE